MRLYISATRFLFIRQICLLNKRVSLSLSLSLSMCVPCRETHNRAPLQLHSSVSEVERVKSIETGAHNECPDICTPITNFDVNAHNAERASYILSPYHSIRLIQLSLFLIPHICGESYGYYNNAAPTLKIRMSLRYCVCVCV